jgi:GxxExxY protein
MLRPSRTASTIIGCAIEVHRELGPGLLESAYERCLALELKAAGLAVRQQVAIPILYKGSDIDCSYRADLIVADEVIVEVKSVEALTAVHTAQALTYLRLTKLAHALLLNFNTQLLKHGIRSVRLGDPQSASDSTMKRSKA